MKWSDLFMVLVATALLNPCFLKNKDKTALASSLSAANRVGDTTFKLNEPSIPESAGIIYTYKKDVNNVKERITEAKCQNVLDFMWRLKLNSKAKTT